MLLGNVCRRLSGDRGLQWQAVGRDGSEGRVSALDSPTPRQRALWTGILRGLKAVVKAIEEYLAG